MHKKHHTHLHSVLFMPARTMDRDALLISRTQQLAQLFELLDTQITPKTPTYTYIRSMRKAFIELFLQYPYQKSRPRMISMRTSRRSNKPSAVILFAAACALTIDGESIPFQQIVCVSDVQRAKTCTGELYELLQHLLAQTTDTVLVTIVDPYTISIQKEGARPSNTSITVYSHENLPVHPCRATIVYVDEYPHEFNSKLIQSSLVTFVTGTGLPENMQYDKSAKKFSFTRAPEKDAAGASVLAHAPAHTSTRKRLRTMSNNDNVP